MFMVLSLGGPFPGTKAEVKFWSCLQEHTSVRDQLSSVTGGESKFRGLKLHHHHVEFFKDQALVDDGFVYRAAEYLSSFSSSFSNVEEGEIIVRESIRITLNVARLRLKESSGQAEEMKAHLEDYYRITNDVVSTSKKSIKEKIGKLIEKAAKCDLADSERLLKWAFVMVLFATFCGHKIVGTMKKFEDDSEDDVGSVCSDSSSACSDGPSPPRIEPANASYRNLPAHLKGLFGAVSPRYRRAERVNSLSTR